METNVSSVADSAAKTRAGYVLGGLSFIPLVGVAFGLIAIAIGVTKKAKTPIVLGSLGILLTVTIYGNLYYWGSVAKTGPFAELKVQLVEQVMNGTAGQVALYAQKNKKLPATLKDLGEPSVENPIFTVDPWGTEMRYTPGKGGAFELRSAGVDESFDTEDDIIKSF